MESISKSRIQGVWDPAHYTRLRCHLHPAAATFHPAAAAITPGCQKLYTRLPKAFHSAAPLFTFDCRHFTSGCHHFHPDAAIFHPDVSHPEIYCHHSTWMFTSRILTPDGRGERFNFLGHIYPDLLIALTRRVSQPFCIVPRGSPKASRYV